MRSYVAQGKMRRVPTYYQDLIDIVGKNPGNVIGSTACLGGFLGTKILQYRELNEDINFRNQIKNWLILMQNIFGYANFYLEMQPSNNDEQIYVNQEILKLSKELSIPYIITLDSHYTKKEDAKIHKAYLNSQDGDREVESFYATTYLMDTKELETFFPYMSELELQKAYYNILEIKNMCEDFTLLKPLKIPSLKWKKPKKEFSIFEYDEYFQKIPYLKTFYESDFEGDKRMVDLIIEKLQNDSRLNEEIIYKELNENLESTWISSNVNKAHWSAYFLNLQNVLDLCWQAGSLVGPGRGSGVGFLLLYILDIIQINCLWETTKTFGWRLTDGLKASFAW